MTELDMLEANSARRHFGLKDSSLIVKDAEVVRAISSLLSTDLGGARLVFAGGTCLARAHRLVQRMSEDVDLKVSIPDMETMSGNALKKTLSGIKKSVISSLQEAGFRINPDKDVESRNQNRNVDIRFPYGAPPEGQSVLDPMIKLELVCKPTRLPTSPMPLRTLMSEAFGREPEITSIDCVSLTETAAEKVVSLTRRVAVMLENARPDVPFDHRLVRHIFDLHAMRDAVDMDKVRSMARELCISDAAEFRNQYQGYASDPVGWTARAMEDMEKNSVHRQDYDAFVQEMVYGEKADFDTAFASVCGIVDGLWPSAGVYVPDFPPSTHELTPANGCVRIVDRITGKVDNPSGPAIVGVDGTEKWFRDGSAVDAFKPAGSDASARIVTQAHAGK